MKWLPWILVGLLFGVVLYLWNRPEQHLTSEVVRDTTEYIDTIPYYQPIPKDSVVIRYEVVKLPIKKDSCLSDSIIIPDSVDVEMPIIQKEYKDSLYRAWVSGYNAKLDSIEVYSRIQIITEQIFIKPKRKRLGIGLQAGYGYPGGWYIGAGISYNLFMW